MNFRTYLQKELIKRCKSNPHYSLRAFARQIDVDPSRLSKILKGERPTRHNFIESTGGRLGLSAFDIEKYKRHESPIKLNRINLAKQKKALELTMDQFELISEWQHFAILQLIQVKNFEPRTKWIAHALGINVAEVHDCIHRLLRVDLLKIDEKGVFHDQCNGATSFVLGKNYSTQAHKQHQKKLLQLATLAIDEIDITNRDQSSRMIATNHKKIQQAKEMIKEFRDKLDLFLSDADEKDTIYQLSVSLYPLSNKEFLKNKTSLEEN